MRVTLSGDGRVYFLCRECFRAEEQAGNIWYAPPRYEARKPIVTPGDHGK